MNDKIINDNWPEYRSYCKATGKTPTLQGFNDWYYEEPERSY